MLALESKQIGDTKNANKAKEKQGEARGRTPGYESANTLGSRRCEDTNKSRHYTLLQTNKLIRNQQ